ncbi:MAG: hypothetical protein E7266_04305 [Lachnospiraceae bacterium]|nr:hypothetical protein [Lachnospiraceae bacterium]
MQEKKRMSKKRKITILIAIICTIFTLACVAFVGVAIYYAVGIYNYAFVDGGTWLDEIDEELMIKLKEDYELAIPAEYRFIEGRDTVGWSEPVIELHFAVNKDDFENMLSYEWEERKGHKRLSFFDEDINIEEISYKYMNDTKNGFKTACLYYSTEGDSIHCYLILDE